MDIENCFFTFIFYKNIWLCYVGLVCILGKADVHLKCVDFVQGSRLACIIRSVKDQILYGLRIQYRYIYDESIYMHIYIMYKII